MSTTVVVNNSQTYAASENGTVFQFTGSGWSATLAGTSQNDSMDFSQYNYGEYDIGDYEKSGSDLVFTYIRYEASLEDGESIVGTIRIKDYFASENRIADLKLYDYRTKSVKEYNLLTDANGGSGNDFILKTTTNNIGNSLYDDPLEGGAGDDVMYGTEGNDTLYGGDGNDRIESGDGNDYLEGQFGNDELDGGDGDDHIYGGVGNDQLYGGDGNDQFYDSWGNNEIFGENGNDYLCIFGDANNTPYNKLNGGRGSDTYSVEIDFDANTRILIDQLEFDSGDADVLKLTKINRSDVQFSLNSINVLTITHISGGTVLVSNWNENPLSKIVFKDGSEMSSMEVTNMAVSGSNGYELNWTLGGNTVLTLAEVGDQLQINGYKENDFVITKSESGNLVLTDAKLGTITISNWPSNNAPSIGFSATDYTKVLNGDQVNAQLFNATALPNTGTDSAYTYNSGISVRQEFDINFNTSTNIVINSITGAEDRIKLTDNHSYDDVYIQIKGGDLYIYNWDSDPQVNQQIDGQIVIKDVKNSTIKTIEFGDTTIHLIGEEIKSFVGADTVIDRYLFLDTAWNGTDTTVPNWNVTIDGVSGQDVLDFQFLPNNSRYYDLSSQADGNDMILTYRYSLDGSNGATLGTVRLKNFYNSDGTMNTANGYPKIRTSREVYAGGVSDSAWDSWKWELSRKYRWLSLNAGTSGDDSIDLRISRPDNTSAWLYYAGDGNDTVTAQAGDIVYGGAGNDTINATGSFSDVHGGKGADTIVVQGADGQNLDHVVVRADKGNDILTAYGSYHYVHGGAEDDEIHLRDDGNGTDIAHNSIALGGAGNDTIKIHAGHDHRAVGGNGNDKLYAYLGDNHILNGEIHIIDDGTKRSDHNRAYGGDDNDFLYIENGGNNHYLYGNAGDDYLSVDGDNNVLDGGDGNDTLTVVAGSNNTLYGGAGIDTLYSGAGKDYLNGGTGSDTYSVTNLVSDTNITIDQSIYNEGDADVLQLSSVCSSDVHFNLVGGVLSITHDDGGTISISGWDVNPLNKIIFANNAALTGAEVTALATTDNFVVTVNESKTYTASGTGTVFQVTGSGYDAVLTGTSSLDSLDFSQYADGEYGCNMSQSGNDLVIEVAKYTGDQVEEQTYVGTVTLEDYFNTDDRLTNLRRCEYEDGNVVGVVDLKLIVGGNYNVDVAGTNGKDWIVTGNGNKTVDAGAGNDYIQVGWGDTGSEGTQIINAGAGDDEIYADGGWNTLNGDTGNDIIFVENTNNNTLNGGAGNDVLEAYGTGHILNGGENNDILNVHGSDNTLNGGAGNDTLEVIGGIDNTLDGGAGNDTYIVHWPLRSGTSESPHNVTINNRTAVNGDVDDLVVEGANSSDFTMYISGGNNDDFVIQKNMHTPEDNCDYIVIHDWSNHRLESVTFDDKSFTNNELYRILADKEHTFFMNQSKTYEGGQWKDVFTYYGTGVNATVTNYVAGEDAIDVRNEGISQTELVNNGTDVKFTVGSGSVTVANGAGQTISLKDSRGSYTASNSAITLGADFTGTARLAIKESDRARACAEELDRFGVAVTVGENDVTIGGAAIGGAANAGSGAENAPALSLHAPTAVLSGHNDHRIVMAMALLCTVTGGTIDGAEAVAKSYPDFFAVIAAAGIALEWED